MLMAPDQRVEGHECYEYVMIIVIYFVNKDKNGGFGMGFDSGVYRIAFCGVEHSRC